MTTTRTTKRESRRARIRSKISGTAARPRLAVFRSNKFIYAQLIDDVAGKTLAAAQGKVAAKVGETVAKTATAAGITHAAFDRGGYQYTGQVKALADGARKGGLQF